ncbi:hypothetical protein JHK85_001017 [Glycine max]|nr:hypothetical protein JHK85_001017 [Glycine max]KAG5088370.1 hypothetical protein JHK86_000982 [Glycine max]
MENVFALVYCNGDVIPSYEGIVFECPGDPKFITISEDMSLTALRKRIFESNGGCIILIHPFYHQPIYVGDSCVEYDCMELKGDDDVGKIFFIYSEISTKDLIELNATFGRSPNEILVLVHKPKKPRTLDEISDLMRDESETPITLVQVCSLPKFTSGFSYKNTINSLLTSFVNSVAFANHNSFTVLASSDVIYGLLQCCGNLANNLALVVRRMRSPSLDPFAPSTRSSPPSSTLPPLPTSPSPSPSTPSMASSSVAVTSPTTNDLIE